MIVIVIHSEINKHPPPASYYVQVLGPDLVKHVKECPIPSGIHVLVPMTIIPFYPI